MSTKVIVVTGLDLGWDCVIGVFSGVSEELLRKQFPEDSYAFHNCVLEDIVPYYNL